MKIAYEHDYIDSLVLKARQGDDRAKEDLCKCFRRLVYKLSKTAYETIEYEDMAQTLWLVFLEKLPLYDAGRGLPFPAYMKRHLTYAALNYMRQHEMLLKHSGIKDGKTKELLLSGEIRLDGVRQNWYEIGEPSLSEKEVNALIHGFHLTKRQEEVLRLRMEGYSWLTIGEICHISYKNVYKHKRKIQALARNDENFKKYFA